MDPESATAGSSESSALPIVDPEDPPDRDGVTTVEVKPTGHVRWEIGRVEFEFAFAGDTLRAFLDALFGRHPELESMLVAETEAEATTDGWADPPGDLPGSWYSNPDENTRPFARVLVNGRFNELQDGFSTTLEDGDRVALVYPFMYCC